VNVVDLSLTGAKSPDSVVEGDRFRFVAQVVEYNPNQCLLFLALSPPESGKSTSRPCNLYPLTLRTA